MSTQPDSPDSSPEFAPPAPNAPPPVVLSPDEIALAQKIHDYINKTWGLPLPACPFCRHVSWAADPVPVVLQKVGLPTGLGVPVFLYWCTNCGFEVPISVAATGLWKEVYPDQEGPEAAGPSDEKAV